MINIFSLNKKPKYTRKFGWFEFSDKPIIINNFISNQSLTVIKTKKDRNGKFYYCEYKDPQIEAEIKLFFPLQEKKIPFIELDYQFTFDKNPSYGLWRRIDDFVSDALLCWPPFLFEFKMFRLYIYGGYSNSEYSSSYLREFYGLGLNPNISMDDYEIAAPILYPLDIKTPLKWCFRDVDFLTSNVELSYTDIPNSKAQILNLSDNLDSFQSSVPYLEREDKNAYIFPSKIYQGMAGGPSRYPVLYINYTIINENTYFESSSSKSLGVNLLQNKIFGYRDKAPNKKYWRVSPLGQAKNLGDELAYYQSYPGWRESLSELSNAWSAWNGSKQTIPIDKSIFSNNFWKTKLEPGSYGNVFFSGYKAGMTDSMFKVINKYHQ